jgi:hypothetical protein
MLDVAMQSLDCVSLRLGSDDFLHEAYADGQAMLNAVVWKMPTNNAHSTVNTCMIKPCHHGLLGCILIPATIPSLICKQEHPVMTDVSIFNVNG